MIKLILYINKFVSIFITNVFLFQQQIYGTNSKIKLIEIRKSAFDRFYSSIQTHSS